jgi:predicted ATPase/class 3 adenylate cyclase
VGSVVTLLVTDIVGSTRLWALYPEEMAENLAAHDDAIGRVVASSGGSVFKHTGDGAMALFADPSAAVKGAAEIQRVIGATTWSTPEPLSVRVAVNTGTVVERHGDVFGTPVNRTARILDFCPAGAVVVGSATAALLRDAVLDPLTLRLVGPVELRGLAEPETLHVVAGAGLVEVAPIAAPAEANLTRPLPVADEPLVGRAEELKAVMGAVLAHPVVSIVGAGGMGKTRLALEVIGDLAGEFADRVWWCDLSVATAPEAVPPVVLDALATRQAAGRSPTESICDGLAGRHALVVLDNCEHVLDVVRELVSAIRTSCPTVRVLATGREALRVRGEQVMPLSSLPVDDAVTLFVDRVLATRPDIALGPDELAAAREVCVRLDGIPLAVELAAARCRSMSPSEVSARLSDRFRLLRGGRPTNERHRTLQAAVAWSYDLLAEDERDLFDQLAVFADGCLVDGIAAVAGLDDFDALDLLDRLVARSMVVPVITPLGTRYRQLETLRQFAEDRLAERAMTIEVRDRHLGWMRGLAEAIRSTEGTPSAGSAFRRYCAEVDNMRVAVAHAIASSQRHTAVDIVADTWRCALNRPTLEAQHWFDPIEATPPWDVAIAAVVGLHGCLAFIEGDIDRIGSLVASVPSEYRYLLPVTLAWNMDELYCRGNVETSEQILARCRPRNESEARLIASQLVSCAYIRMQRDGLGPDLVESTRRLAADGVARARRLGDDIDTAWALFNLAFAHAYGGGYDVALAAASEAIALTEPLGAGFATDAARLALGLALARMSPASSRDAPQVAAMIRQSIELAREHNDRPVAANMLHSVAVLVEPYDAETAYLLKLVYRRAPGSVIPVSSPAYIPSDRQAEIEGRAAVIPFDDAVVLAVASLDRHYPA